MDLDFCGVSWWLEPEIEQTVMDWCEVVQQNDSITQRMRQDLY